MAVIIIRVTAKFRVASFMPQKTDSLRFEKVSPRPLSKRIMISAITEKIFPTFPRESNVMRLKSGPRIMPIRTSIRTSGILVFSKNFVKKWAKKIRSPTSNIAECISIPEIIP